MDGKGLKRPKNRQVFERVGGGREGLKGPRRSTPSTTLRQRQYTVAVCPPPIACRRPGPGRHRRQGPRGGPSMGFHHHNRYPDRFDRPLRGRGS